MPKYDSIAFCGGGGKGAYQIGVWKALRERGLDRDIKAVSGTSVGALNAVLFSYGDLELAEKIWNGLKPSDLFCCIDITGEFPAFSRDGLRAIIKEVPLSKLRIPVYINAYEKNKGVRSELINGMPEEKLTEWLLASSAIPVIYPSETIDEKEYIDGGTPELTNFLMWRIAAGNTPIDRLYAGGYRNILLSALDDFFNIFNLYDENSEHISISGKYPEAVFTELVPLESMGGPFKGVLNFSHKDIVSRIELGRSCTLTELDGDRIEYGHSDYNKINYIMRTEFMKLFSSKEELELFIKKNRLRFSLLNIDTAVLGGNVWYENIAEVFGYKLQQHKAGAVGELTHIRIPHYRLLDPDNVRVAWTAHPQKLIGCLYKYEDLLSYIS